MKTRDLQWYDLFNLRGTRRDFLRLSSSVAGLVALGSIPGCSGRSGPRRVASYPFTLGVASGDPLPDGVVLWTRLAREALEGAGAHTSGVEVAWEISDTEGFTNVIHNGTVTAPVELGHSAHAEVGGLEPGREYFYRWIVAGEVSPVGRTKTAPLPDADVDAFRFAFASCQQYEHGHYTAYHHIAEERFDLIVHLGDYIYESSWGTPIRRHEGPEIVTLDDYRARYYTYKSEPNLMEAHASAPWVLTWDDHELDNNWAGNVPEDDQSPEAFALRKAAAFQAYYEFMPLRRSSVPRGLEMQLYRAHRFGNLLDMTVLDTRQYRHDQPCGDGGVPTCAEHMEPGRSILGTAQRNWLFNRLAQSDTRWNVMAQQVMVARLRGQNDEGDETWSMDKWDGYPLERQTLIDHLTAVTNPIVLTGDIHSNWVGDLHTDFEDTSSPVVGTEFTGTSISSGGNGVDVSNGARRTLSYNPHLKFYNGQRGYVASEIAPDRWTAHYEVVPVVTEPGGAKETRATFVVEAGRPGAVAG